MVEIESVGKSRALITETEREHLTGANGDDKKYQAATRIRRRITEELEADVTILKNHDEDLLEELRTAISTENNTTLTSRLAKHLTSTPGSDEELSNLPSERELLSNYDRLLYSSSMVEQSYTALIGAHKPVDTSERYVDAAVLQQRDMGVGITPFTNKNEDDGHTTGEEARTVPNVYKVTGELVIRSERDDDADKPDVNTDDMFVNELRTDEQVFTDFGSIPNYHPLIQQHVHAGNSFHVESATGYFIEYSEEATSNGQIHFMQLAGNQTQV